MTTINPPLATTAPYTAAEPDTGFIHFLKYLGIGLVMWASTFLFGAGLVWMAFAMSSTGRRKRDILMLLVPVWGSIVVVQTIWRYTSKNIYWSVREDRPSKSLFSS